MSLSNTESKASDVGVADYFNSHPEDAASILVAKAPDVLVLSHCVGAPKTARYFAKSLGCKVTEKMIKTIKIKVAKDILLVTREELEAAALSHPVTAARMARTPSLCDPQWYRSATQRKSRRVVFKQSVEEKISKNEKTTDIEIAMKTHQEHLSLEEMQKAKALLDDDDQEDAEFFS